MHSLFLANFFTLWPILFFFTYFQDWWYKYQVFNAFFSFWPISTTGGININISMHSLYILFPGLLVLPTGPLEASDAQIRHQQNDQHQPVHLFWACPALSLAAELRRRRRQRHGLQKTQWSAEVPAGDLAAKQRWVTRWLYIYVLCCMFVLYL